MLGLGRYEEANAYYDKALGIDENDMSTLNNKGLALYELGRYEEAITYYDRALAEINPVDVNATVSIEIKTLNNKGVALCFRKKYRGYYTV